MQINGGRISAKIFHKWLVRCIRVLNKLNPVTLYQDIFLELSVGKSFRITLARGLSMNAGIFTPKIH